MDNCIFCKIISGEIPSKKVYEDEYCIAFHDINPQMPIHIVVAAKRHAPSILNFTASDADALTLGHIQLAIAQIARELSLDEKGFRVINNCGEYAGQTVPHLHYHILAGAKMSEHIV